MEGGDVSCNLPVRSVMCSTCPFRPGVPAKYAAVRDVIAESATTEATRICHQTGSDNAFHRRTGRPRAVCAGARELQLKMFHSMGVISAPTNEAWNAARVKIGMRAQEVLA